MWCILAWAVLAAAAGAIVLGTLGLALGENVTGVQVAIGVLWMKLVVIVALYWATGLRAVGHAGGSASIAWADPDERLPVAFLCNRMISGSSKRYRRIGDAVYGALS